MLTLNNLNKITFHRINFQQADMKFDLMRG